MENKWKEWLEQWREHPKLPKKNQLFLLFLVGVLLLVIIWPVPENDRSESQDGTAAITEVQNDSQEYQEYLEKRVAAALERVEGVGKTEVVITLKSSAEKVVEKDSISDSQKTEEEDSQGGTRVTQEQSAEKSSVYEQQADGGQFPYVRKELAPEIEGVMVVAEGGDNAVVIRDITEAIQALFGVEAHKIKIMKRTDT